MAEPIVVCPECKREVGGYVPARGDGSMLRPRRHKAEGRWCPGEYDLADKEVDRG